MGRKKIAAVVTTWFTNSHADVIVGKFIRGARAAAMMRRAPAAAAGRCFIIMLLRGSG